MLAAVPVSMVGDRALGQGKGPDPQHPTTTCAALADFHAPSVETLKAVDQPAGPFQQGRPGRAPGGAGGPVGPRAGAGGGPPAGAGAPAPAIVLPAHCLVTGVIDKRIGVGGKPYGIHFEMRLPVDWNGRFLFEGGGGINGRVSPAIGQVKGPPALTRGFAVITQDAGHTGGDASFGEDQQARIDMIYRSYDRVTAMGKQLVSAYYGKPADHSYFMGCSEGGREALLVSQRQPLDFDGVVAGDPGFLLGVSFNPNADHQTIVSIAPKGPDGKPDVSKVFTDADVKLVADAIEGDCDAKDGLKDGLIDNPTACRPNLEKLICKGEKTDTCLSKAQVHALREIYDGGRPSGDHVVTAGYFYDTSVDEPIWRGKLAGRLATGGGPGVDSVQGLFLTPYDPTFDDAAFDFKKDGARLDEVGALNRADAVTYSSFKQHGGKLLVYTGLGDPAFSAKELIAYYRRLGQANGGPEATGQFARLFLVPGMTHCSGGKSLDTFDPLQAVVDWVEHDTAPQHLIATGKAFPGRSRPICAYPAQSRYKGTGSIEDAANFECRVPDQKN
jgi:feruloyl esterase